ncbi:MAG: hypothetical protein B7X06_01940 [Verrucomicrobia bacterium 21-51-4]|nr:MAG: hypothetical protein B7X06_01940 [Verrucomicrobia bacterium 21-51-4]
MGESCASYGLGVQAHLALEAARERVARRVGVDAEQIVFTSGATEGNHAVLRYWAKRFVGRAVALSPFEHPSVYTAAELYFGDACHSLPIDALGRVDLQATEALLEANPDIRCLTLTAASHETGIHQPWGAMAQLCRARGVAYHCDASQWAGRESMGEFFNCDFVTAGAHKLGGPVGVGWLKISGHLEDFCIQPGGGQEAGYRSGTPAVPLILAMASRL